MNPKQMLLFPLQLTAGNYFAATLHPASISPNPEFAVTVYFSSSGLYLCQTHPYRLEDKTIDFMADLRGETALQELWTKQKTLRTYHVYIAQRTRDTLQEWARLALVKLWKNNAFQTKFPKQISLSICLCLKKGSTVPKLKPLSQKLTCQTASTNTETFRMSHSV